MIIDMEESLYSYDRLKADAETLADQYDRIIKCVTIGVSHDNRDILMLKLGIGRKYLLFCAGVHGRESINPIVMMALAEYYAQEYQTYSVYREGPKDNRYDSKFHLEVDYNRIMFGKCIYDLLQTYTILIIPLLNPDGYMISLTGFQAIENENYRRKALGRNIVSTEWKYNARGVDINRNFPCRLWKPKGPEDHVASENETLALIAVFHQYRIKGFIDVHSRGKSIYYHRQRMPVLYNERQLKVALRLQNLTKYLLMPPEEEVDPGDSGGNTVHYFSEHFYRIALTIETVEDEAGFPLDIKYRESTFKELKLLFFELGSLLV